VKRITILTAAVLVVAHVSVVRAVQIEEISVDSIDTTFTYVAVPITDSQLLIEQAGVNVVVEKAGNVQEHVSGAFFSLVTNLQADNSIGGKAMADFQGGALIIKDALNVVLLSGDINQLGMEENTNLPQISILTGAGTFDVTGGTWASSFGTDGIIMDLTWMLGTNVPDFRSSFTAESDVTLIPEPSVLAILAFGGLALLRRKKK